MQRLKAVAAVMVALALAVPACKRSDQARPHTPVEAATSWAKGRWRFSQSAGSPKAGWVEFAPGGRRGVIRVVDYACPPDTGCKTDGTFEVSEEVLTLHVRQWDSAPFKVRASAKTMEWIREGKVVVRLNLVPPPAAPSPDQKDRPLTCKKDGDCPKVLSCGPCKPDQPITSLHLRVQCYKNPCPGRKAYCNGDGICAVKP